MFLYLIYSAHLYNIFINVYKICLNVATYAFKKSLRWLGFDSILAARTKTRVRLCALAYRGTQLWFLQFIGFSFSAQWL